MCVVEDRICETITRCTDILDHNWQISQIVADDRLSITAIVMQDIQGVLCFPVVAIFVNHGEIIGFQRLPVEPSDQQQHHYRSHGLL